MARSAPEDEADMTETEVMLGEDVEKRKPGLCAERMSETRAKGRYDRARSRSMPIDGLVVDSLQLRKQNNISLPDHTGTNKTQIPLLQTFIPPLHNDIPAMTTTTFPHSDTHKSGATNKKRCTQQLVFS